MKDEVAIPFLVRLLQQREMLAAGRAPALGRIGTPAAADALIQFANDASEDRRVSARIALNHIARDTRDAALKQKIANVLH